MSPRAREYQEYSGPDKRVKVRTVIQRHLEPAPRSGEWWTLQAWKASGGACPKCKGLVTGIYVPPTRHTQGECCTVAHCVTCGWEEIRLKGENGVPNGIDNG